MKVFLALLETSGNQNFIFATNRMRENVGASELVRLAGTRFVLESLPATRPLWDPDPAELRRRLADPLRNPPVENPDSPGIEILLATSGKAMALARRKEDALELARQATLRALLEAPGLECSAVLQEFEWDQPGGLHRAVQKAHENLESPEPPRGSGLLRFPRQPLFAPCDHSGRPACGTARDGDRLLRLSRESLQKRNHAESWIGRVHKLFPPDLRPPGNLWDLEKHLKEGDWLAVFHGDGNGFGSLFLNFQEYCGASSNRQYADRLRKFSQGLEHCAEEAFRGALAAAIHEKIVPLVLGGDDVTLIGEARAVYQVAKVYLEKFEQQTAGCPDVSEIARNAFRTGSLSASAGLAVVKPHFPFFEAYSLAEDLLRSAKDLRKDIPGGRGKSPPCSALDFHVVLDASVSNLETIRRRLRVGDARLTARPYLVGENLPSDWGRARSLAELQNRAVLVRRGRKGDKGRPPELPSSQLHDLREGLFLGREAADARLKLVLHRYPKLGELVEDGPEISLFRRVEGREWSWETRFLDALDLADFLVPEAP